MLPAIPFLRRRNLSVSDSMADYNLDDLLAALREVADASDPDSVADSDPADDDENIPEDEDSDGEEDAQSFQKPKLFNTVMLLERLQTEAEQKQFENRRVQAIQQRIKQQPTKLEEKNAKLKQMHRKAADAERELKLNQQLEIQSERLQKARLELYKANKTDRERMQLDADTERMATWASRYCKEAGSDWREKATAAFQNKKL
jgi:hypothetical protein